MTLRAQSCLALLALAAALLLPGPNVGAGTNDLTAPLPAVTRGDVNGDWDVDLSDVVGIYGWLYLGGAPLAPTYCGADSADASGDTNSDGIVDVSDGIYLLSYLFLGGPAPADLQCGGDGGGASVRRPLSDFLESQGTFCQDILGTGDCYLFVPPSPNFLGWSNDIDTNDDGDPDTELLFSGVDYAGLANAHFGGVFGTSLEGSVSERPLPDGRAEITVLLRARGANGWVIALDQSGDVLAQIAGGPTHFGHRPQDVVAGAAAARGDSFLHTVFTVEAPGAPLPDLLQAVFAPSSTLELRSLRFLWRARGSFNAASGYPDGTPGVCTIQQNGVLARGSHAGLPDGDGFPAEFINLTPTAR